jgi:hypothetical protein
MERNDIIFFGRLGPLRQLLGVPAVQMARWIGVDHSWYMKLEINPFLTPHPDLADKLEAWYHSAINEAEGTVAQDPEFFSTHMPTFYVAAHLRMPEDEVKVKLNEDIWPGVYLGVLGWWMDRDDFQVIRASRTDLL